MEVFEMIIYSVVAIILVVLAVFSYFYAESVRSDSDKKLQYVVDQINNSQYYSYNFDTEQQTNIQNLDHNINAIEKKIESIDNGLKVLNTQSLTKNDIGKSFTTDTVNAEKINVGKEYELSTLPDSTIPSNNPKSLFLYSADGTLGNMSMDRLYLNGINIKKDANIDGKTFFGADVDVKKTMRVGKTRVDSYPNEFKDDGIHTTNVYANGGKLSAGTGGDIYSYVGADGTMYAGNDATFMRAVKFPTEKQNDLPFQIKRMGTLTGDNLRIYMNSMLNNNNQNLEVYMGPCKDQDDCAKFTQPKLVVKSTGEVIINGLLKVCNQNGENCRNI